MMNAKKSSSSSSSQKPDGGGKPKRYIKRVRLTPEQKRAIARTLYPIAPEPVYNVEPSKKQHKGKWMDLRNTYHLPAKLLFSCIGIVIISLAIAVCRIGGVGVDPFTSMNIGISEKIGLSLGTYQLIVNAVILVAVFFFDKWQIGLGTIVNMVAVGYLVEFFAIPLSMLPSPDGNILLMGVYLVVGTLLFTLGISMYLKTGMGVSPYDAIAPMISDRFHKSYAITRVIQDVMVLVIAFFAGGPFGIFTFIAAFCSGPLITMWDRVASRPLYKQLRVLDKSEIAEQFA